MDYTSRKTEMGKHSHVKDHHVKPKDDVPSRKPVINPPQTKTKVHVDRNSSSTEKNVGTRPSVVNTGEKVLLHRLKDDRERDILNQSLKRTKVLTGGQSDAKVQQQRTSLKGDNRERDILNQSLKRTKGEDSKGEHTRLRDERDTLNPSLKRTKVTGGEDVKLVQRRPKEERDRDMVLKDPSLKRTQVRDHPKGERLREADTKTTTQGGEGHSKVRHEKPKSVHATGDQGHVSQKIVKKQDSKELPPVKDRDHAERTPKSVGGGRPHVTTTSLSRKEEDHVVKKGNVSGERKRPTGVKLDDGKYHVRVRSVVGKTEQAIATSHSTSKNGSSNVPKEPLRSVKVVTGSTVVKAKQEKLKKKVFSLPGQRFEPPEERDALRLFYGSLHRQIPTSDMANIWLMEHGLLEADEAQKVLTHKVKPKTGSVSKAPVPARFSNGSAGKSSKFKNEGFLDIKPVSKKLKL